MLRSMTGYGRGEASGLAGTIVVEVSAYNRKWLEVFVQLPDDLWALEAQVRRWVAQKVGRGVLYFRISADLSSEGIAASAPNTARARELAKAWVAVGEVIGWDAAMAKDPVLYAQRPDMPMVEISSAPADSCRDLLQQAVDSACASLIADREDEGRQIAIDILQRCQTLQQGKAEIEENATEAVAGYRQKLLERLCEFGDASANIDERALREVALFAEKCDITEEIVRFDLHLQQFQEWAEGAQEPVGKALDFLLQEMVREASTMAAKTSSRIVSQAVVLQKTELEKMREQVRNVE